MRRNCWIWLLVKNIIQKSGGLVWFIRGNKIGQGKLLAQNYLKENKGVREKILKSVLKSYDIALPDTKVESAHKAQKPQARA